MTIQSIKARLDRISAVSPVPTDPRRMTDEQLMTAIIQIEYGRPPTQEELSPEGRKRVMAVITTASKSEVKR